jgi:L-ascorbate metabolism protein UlaG (beta-lactamase superfamily)
MERFSGGEAPGGAVSLIFRWLGVAGVELRVGNEVLAIDPFFTRPSLLGLLRPVSANHELVAKILPICNYVLVTHSHWDHLMDVPAVLYQTGAVAYGSKNTCQLLDVLGVPPQQVNRVQVGEKISLGAFNVEVIQGKHSKIPLSYLFNGDLRRNLAPPLHMQDYRMDTCLGYYINVAGRRMLICAEMPRACDVLFAVAQETREYYLQLFRTAQPRTFIPIHWDNFVRPLHKPLRKFTRPGRLSLKQLTSLARRNIPGVQVIVPEILKEYLLKQ